MKSLSLLKKIALGSGVLASVTPIALMSTSCAIESMDADYVEFKDIVLHKNYSTAKLGKQSFKRLLFGSKKVYGGNYVLFVGSSMSNTACSFYTGQTALRSRTNWFKTSEEDPAGYFDKGAFWEGIRDAGDEPNIKNFAIFNAIDFWDGKVYDNKGHEIVVCEKTYIPTQVINPFTKWNATMIAKTKECNDQLGYKWDEKSVTADKDYVRNDSSAVAYRAFINTGLQVYPTNDKRKKSFDVTDGNKAYMLVFVDGKLKSQGKDEKELVDVLDMPTTAKTWHETITKYFKEEEPKK